MTIKNRRRRFFANQMHREMFLLVFFGALIPAVITAIGLFYLIFYITAEQFGIPEVIVYNLIPASKRVITIILTLTPLSLGAISILAYKITHRAMGPFDRIVRELDEHIKNKKPGRIVLRKGDKFQPLVDRINVLLSHYR